MPQPGNSESASAQTDMTASRDPRPPVHFAFGSDEIATA